jgi:hypothetical protein
MEKKIQIAWQKSGRLYDELVRAQGHDYHRHDILPTIALALEEGVL